MTTVVPLEMVFGIGQDAVLRDALMSDIPHVYMTP